MQEPNKSHIFDFEKNVEKVRYDRHQNSGLLYDRWLLARNDNTSQYLHWTQN